MLEHRTEPLRLNIRHLLYPLLVLYATSYALLLQQSFPPQSQVLLIIKLVVGAAILCASSFFLLKKSGSKVQFMPHRIDWTMVTYCVVLALFLLYLFVWFNLALFPGVYPKTISYYGPFDIVSPLYLPILLAMSVYVLGEELFFKGVAYQYFRTRLSFLASLTAVTGFFAWAHMNPNPLLVVVLVIFSLTTTLLFIVTRTFLYGFIVHAALDILAVLLSTRQFHIIMLENYTLKLLVLTILCLGLTGFLLFSKRYNTSEKTLSALQE